MLFVRWRDFIPDALDIPVRETKPVSERLRCFSFEDPTVVEKESSISLPDKSTVCGQGEKKKFVLVRVDN
jgi:hypothetical protein